MAHFISSFVLYKCPANLFTSMMDQKLSLSEQSLWENFIYCLDENKLKRVQKRGPGRGQKELRIVLERNHPENCSIA